jgi:hypothetical protein
MNISLTDDQLLRAKDFIFKNGRLIERKLFEYFFEQGSQENCLKALAAYQNEDGGFGNGIEPDLLCPDSSAIGAETAMYVLDLLDCGNTEFPCQLIDWIITHQTDEGDIPHPPENYLQYPYQPWWKNPDKERVLSLAGYLRKWGIDQPAFFQKVRSLHRSMPLAEVLRYYDYPHFVYLKYCGTSNEDKAELSTIIAQLPTLLINNRDHFPLFGRAWYLASDYVSQEILAREANLFINAFQEDGGIMTPYPDFPWWQPIFLLDGLIQLKKKMLI